MEFGSQVRRRTPDEPVLVNGTIGAVDGLVDPLQEVFGMSPISREIMKHVFL